MKSKNYLRVLITLLLFLPLMTPTVTVSAKEKTIVDVISEMATDGSFILLGNYSINRIGTIVIDSGTEKPQVGTKKDLNIGALAEAQLGDRDSAGQWKAFQLVIFTGESKTKKVAELRGIDKNLLTKTLDTNTSADPTKGIVEKTGSVKQQDSVQLKNGVYSN